MKKIVLFFLLGIVCVSTIKAQYQYLRDSIVYAQAYNYIITDSLFADKVVNVSNKLTGTSYSFFYNELKGDKKLEEYYLLYYPLDEKYASKDSIHIQFNGQFVKQKNAKFIIHFSAIIGDELFADVTMSIFEDTHFGEIVSYYFRFDSEGNIKLVCKQKGHGL